MMRKTKLNLKLWLGIAIVFTYAEVKSQLLYESNYDNGIAGKRQCHVMCNDCVTKTSVLTNSPGGKAGKSIRSSFGNRAKPILKTQVSKIRAGKNCNNILQKDKNGLL